MTRCASCDHENEVDARVCSNCGAPIEVALVCASCGAPNALGQRFCGQCGQKLGGHAPVGRGGRAEAAPASTADAARPPARSAPSERKQVTVLFADVKGSMDLSGSVDVEQWWSIMHRFFELLSDGVARFEGHIDRFTGDGVMAVFGAPSALEDHAQRACHAALWLQRELARYAEEVRHERGLTFVVRMGLNSGEVVVGTIGHELSAEYTAIGHTAGLAQRMESLAHPGGVCVTESTAKLVRGFFLLHEHGAMHVKGVDAPIRVFELIGDQPQTAFDMSIARGLSRFVGRDEELGQLEEARCSMIAGDGQVVAVIGEAGVGKTRLCHEFLERCRADGIAAWTAHALAHMRAVPFVPILELLRDFFEIAPDDPKQLARNKVADRLSAAGEDREGARPLLLDFLGIPDPDVRLGQLDPEARQRRLSAAFNSLVCGRGDAGPKVILLEDLHWIDSGSAAFVVNLVAGIENTRTLLLTTYRPEHQAQWSPRRYFRELRLTSLGARASEAMLADILGADPSLDGIGALVYEHAEGNPFFIEEIVKALADAGTLQGMRGAYRLTRTVDEVAIPATVHAVLAARIDRLTEQEKSLLQTAAVIGHQFNEPVLQRVTGLQAHDMTRALSGLLASELIGPGSGGGEYVFKHSLAERVAYRSQLAEPRAQSHATVAAALAQLYPARIDELAALIAHHWEEAGDFLGAAQWRARAGGWAGFNDPKEALRQWQKARALADAAEDSPQGAELALGTRVMLLNLAWRQGVPEDLPREEFERETALLYEQASTLAKATENLTGETIAVAAYGAVRGLGGHLADMAELGMDALELADRAGDKPLKLSVLPGPVYALYALGRYTKVLDLLDQMSAEFPDDPATVVGVTLLCPYAWVLGWQAAARAHTGGLSQAFAGFEHALALAREHDDHETESWIHMSIVQAMQLAGAGDALAHAQRAQQIAERAGGAFSLGLAWRYLGIAYLIREEWDYAAQALRSALATWRPRRVGLEAEPHALTMLARAQLGLGDSESAGITAQEAVTLAMGRGTRGHELEARLALAQALRVSSGVGAATAIEGHLRRARSLAEETGARTLEPRVHAELAELARLRGDESTWERELECSRRLFVAVGAPALAKRVALSAR